MFKWIREHKEREQEKLKLLKSIDRRLSEIEGAVDGNKRYGNAIKTVSAPRY